MAKVIFNHLATNAVAESAGTMPSREADPNVKKVLEEINITVSEPMIPKKVDDEMLKNADLIVSFGCLISSMFPKEKFQEWHISDPQTIEEFRAVRDELISKIKTLIRESNF